MRFQYRTLPQIIRLKSNRYQTEGLDSTDFSIMIYLCSFRSFIQYHWTPMRSVYHTDEQGPVSLARLSRIGTSCQFSYDFKELKGAAIKYLGALWIKADTESHAEIIGSDLYQCSLVVQNKSLFSYIFSIKKVGFSQIIKNSETNVAE